MMLYVINYDIWGVQLILIKRKIMVKKLKQNLHFYFETKAPIEITFAFLYYAGYYHKLALCRKLIKILSF